MTNNKCILVIFLLGLWKKIEKGNNDLVTLSWPQSKDMADSYPNI